jgi:hypothetical protein
MNAPKEMTKVPNPNFHVNGSCKRTQLKIEFEINPTLCNGLRIINGRVEIWIKLPKTLAAINKQNPHSHNLC